MNKRKKILVIVDMQNDFINGVLGTPEAQVIVPKVVDKIKAKNYDRLVFTYDSHEEDYLQTREGRHLPVPHCQTHDGVDLIDEFGEIFDEKVSPWAKRTEGYDILLKENFALEGNIWRTFVGILNRSLDLFVPLDYDYKGEDLEFEFCGVCTDICVVSNAFAIRQAFPEAEVIIDASCCAGTTPEAHKAALLTMKSCQMNIINEDIV